MYEKQIRRLEQARNTVRDPEIVADLDLEIEMLRGRQRVYEVRAAQDNARRYFATPNQMVSAFIAAQENAK